MRIRVKVHLVALVLAAATTLSPVAGDLATTTTNNNRSAENLNSPIHGEPSQIPRYLTLVGSVESIFKKFHLNSQESALLWKTLSHAVHWEDFLFFTIIGWLSVPALQIPFAMLPESSTSRKHLQESHYFRSIRLVLDQIQQVAKLATLVYAVDVLKLILVQMGFAIFKLDGIPHAFAQTLYTIWIANRLLAVKRHYYHSYVSHHPETFGRMQVLNRLADAALGAATAVIVLSILRVQMGVAMTSFLAFGSVGTLAVGLASQGVAKEILNGLMLASSDRIYEGDIVSFGHNKQVEGKIVKLGWMETVIRGSDDVLWSLPNTALVNQPVSNLSRVRLSQVHQTLRFHYHDTEALPLLMETIKEEIQLACPDLITDGSRPFRVSWTNFGPSHLEAVVDCHFRIKPVSDKYWENRQHVLQAIDRAVKKHQLQFKA